ncbi:MAG: hypothetical protein ACR2K3_00375 [Nocardioides sp.]
MTGTAAAFLGRLEALRAAAGGRAPMREIFALAKEFIDLPNEIEILPEQPEHDASAPCQTMPRPAPPAERSRS